ncbi:cache domain-containing protein [Geodermatophilus chilensis]|uniref:cache domain-containing protein n=1 Tax=Geodermatophilus chilensis TaxID=2035835 RepID=UPI000C257EEE|nr:cache domain-containing protein [Geodermatophilus chilensis]
MSRSDAAEVARVAAAVSDLVEQVFVTVARVHEATLRSVEREGLRAGRWVLPDGVQELLRAPGQLAVGLGLVVAPRPEEGLPLRLEWWQVDPDGGKLHTLEPDLRPTSLGYYDYTVAEWYDVPRRTGRRHAFGPHVDVHGTGRYVLTLTEPVVAGSGFVGVAGADVPVRRFETHLLRALGRLSTPFVLLNDEGRVVLSTAPRFLVGSLLPADAGLPEQGTPVPGVPWRLLLVRDGRLLAG